MKIDAPLGSGLAKRPSALTLARVDDAITLLDTWLAEHSRARVSWSGGKDSTIVVWLAKQARPTIPVCFFNSGAEYPQNEAYIEALAARWDLNLHVYPAQPDAVTVFENAGGWTLHSRANHGRDDLMAALIERPAAAANAEHGANIVYGIRADESAERRALLAPRRGVVERRSRSGDLLEQFVAPIWNWSVVDVESFAGTNGIPLNPLYAQMKRLGMPEKRRRVGPVLNSAVFDTGAWAYSRALAPDLCRRIEGRLPRLAEFR